MLLLLLLQQYPFAFADAVVAILLSLKPGTLQDLDTETSVYRIVASKVTIGYTPVDFMAATVRDMLEVAHSTAV